MFSPHVEDPAERSAAVGVPSGGGSLLVVGNYCHDVLFRDGRVSAESLGGAVSFISSVLDPITSTLGSDNNRVASRHHHCYVSKVGKDFGYAVSHPPKYSSSPTTVFHAYFASSSTANGSEEGYNRTLKRVRACDSISPFDLPSDQSFDFGLAVGVAGEVSPDTLSRMLDICRVVLVDAQSLLRRFDPIDGTVVLVPLRESGFFHLLPRIGFLKASMEETPFVDVEEARRFCCVIVTQGKDGSRVYFKDDQLHVLPFNAVEVDPTGAGDSFLAGFVAGLSRGLAVYDSALLGNLFGSLTVGQIGIPKFDNSMMQSVRLILERLASFRGSKCPINNVLGPSEIFEELRSSLTRASKLYWKLETAEA